MTPIPSIFRNAMAIATVLITLVSSCHAQPKTAPGEYYSKEFNWRVTIPAGFQSVPDTSWQKMKNRGTAAIEQTAGATVEDHSKTLFVFQLDQFDYFESNYQSFDPEKEGDYRANNKSACDLICQTFQRQVPSARMDSSYSTELISGLRFVVFSLDIHLSEQATFHMRMYGRPFAEKRLFTVTILYLDPAKGKPMLDAWRKSTFPKGS
jgi:hypothetical protein